MTATERLRQLLDERGVEWDKGASPNEARTYWQDTVARPWDTQRLYVHALLTPEQAVEATLGRGTCKMEATLTNPFETRIDEYHCSECGEYCSVEKVMGKTEPPRFCPECGRKVES